MTAGELFGVWGGRAPGGWCHFHMANAQHPYWGTREEAERTVAVFRSERPDTPYKYEAIPFDPEKEPEPWPCRVTLSQLRALSAIDADAEGPAAKHWPASRGGFGKSTYDALMDRGLIMSSLGVSAFKLTRAGRSALANQRHMLRKA